MRTRPASPRRGVLRRLGLAAAALPVVLATMTLLAPPANAEKPTGGCWIWYAGVPQSDISRSLALWADPDEAPKGPADHVLTLPQGPAAGSTATMTYSYNKGPANEGPPASVTGTFRFSVNGDTVVEKTVDYGSISTGESIPGMTLKVPWTVVNGENHIVFEGVTFEASAFSVRIDCNGQTSGTAQKNPRTDPQPTNIDATTTSQGFAAGGGPTTPEPPDFLGGLLPCLPGLPIPGLCPEADPDPEPEPAPGDDPGDPADPGDPSAPDAGGGEPGDPAPDDGAAGGSGTPAEGTVTYACVIHPFEADFDYDPTIVVHGSRGSGDTVDLLATMSDLPGIAPVPIDGSMDVTLKGTVDGKPATLTGSSHVTAQPEADVPVPDLTGTISSSADTMPVVIDTFAFDFPTLSVSGDCAPEAGQDLGQLTLGSGGLPGTEAGGGAPTGAGSATTPPATTTPGAPAPPGAGPGAAGAQDIGVVDLRVEGGPGLGELFGGSPRRSLVVVVENRSQQAVEDPLVVVQVARTGHSAEPQQLSLATGPLGPGEQRRLQLPVALDGSGMGTYEITGQIGTTPAGAFAATWGTYPWGLLVLLGGSALLAVTGLLRRFSPGTLLPAGLPTALPAGAAFGAQVAADGAVARDDAGIDIDRLDSWLSRPRLNRRRPVRRLLGM